MDDVSARKKYIGALYIEDVIDFFMKNYRIDWQPPCEVSKNHQEVPVLFTPEIGRTAFIISNMFEYRQTVEESKLHQYLEDENMFFYLVFNIAVKCLEERKETGFFHMSAYAAEVAVFCQLKNIPQRHIDVIAAIMVLLDCKLNLDVEKSRLDYQQLAKSMDDARNKAVMAHQSNSNDNRGKTSYAKLIERITTRPVLVPAYEKPNVNSNNSEVQRLVSPAIEHLFPSQSISYPLPPSTPLLPISAKPIECIAPGPVLLPKTDVNSEHCNMQRLVSPNIVQSFSSGSVSYPLPSSTPLLPISTNPIECTTPIPVVFPPYQNTNLSSINSEEQKLGSIVQSFSAGSFSYPVPPSTPLRPIPVNPIECMTLTPVLLPSHQNINEVSNNFEIQRHVSPIIAQRFPSRSVSYPLCASAPLLPVPATMFPEYPYQNVNAVQYIPASSPAPRPNFMYHQHVPNYLNEGLFFRSAVKSVKYRSKVKNKFRAKSVKKRGKPFSWIKIKKSSSSKSSKVASISVHSSNDNAPELLYSSEKNDEIDPSVKMSEA